MLKLDHVSKIYPNGTHALRDVSLTVEDGEFLFVVGPSGSGKSTMLKLLTGEVEPTQGEIHVNGFDVSNIRQRDIPYLRRTIGVVFQDFRLIENKSVYENVAFVMRAVGAPARTIKKRVSYVLDLVGVLHKARRLPGELSGGEQQRVAIARALVNNPDVIVADEPTGNLDSTNTRNIVEILRSLAHDNGCTVIIVTHDLGVIATMCDEIIVMYGGRVCERGTADDIFYRPAHEYTKGLLRSIPNAANMNERLEPIGGTPINLLNMPKGCAFCPRCDEALKICLSEIPTEYRVSDTHLASCWKNVQDLYEHIGPTVEEEVTAHE